MLELKDVTYTVRENGEDINIIDHLNLTIGDGRFVVITGPNGGGKSTLAKIIMGVNPVNGGRIYLDGQDITYLSITDRAKAGISFAFQKPVVFKGIRVVDILKIASGRRISISEACEYLSKVGLCAKDYINRELNDSLSGGELKRIEIATVLARGTRFSIFDEPEAGIDLWSFGNLIQVFENIRNTVDGTVLIISHQERILNIADEIVVIEDGKVAKQGKRDEILPELIGTASAMNNACSILTKEA